MAALHPQVVHFTIALVIVGAIFRLLSLLGRPAFAAPAATTLFLLAAIAAAVSAQSGTAAHAPVERVPGSRAAVMEHEEWGNWAYRVLVVLGFVEVAGLALRKSSKAPLVRGISAVVGLAGVFTVYQAAQHGGELVYAYAGGVGIRSGKPEDVERLLLAGLYHQAQAERSAGRAAAAAELVQQTARRFPSDPEVQLLAAESLLIDQKSPQAALDALARITVPDGAAFMAVRRVTLQADAFEAAGQKDEAAKVLRAQIERAPNPRLQQRLEGLTSATASPH